MCTLGCVCQAVCSPIHLRPLPAPARVWVCAWARARLPFLSRGTSRSRKADLRQLAAVSGEFDYIAILRVPSPQRLDALLDEIGEIEGVLRTTTSVLLAMRVDRVA